MKVCMMFACIQPEVKGKRPFEKNYFKMAEMCIKSLIYTKFPSNNIVLITPNKEYNSHMKKYGIQCRVTRPMPKEFVTLVNRIPKKHFFYKPFAFYDTMPEPVSDDTIMAFGDVDAIFKRNPTKLFMSRPQDVWSAEGVRLPRRRRNAPPNYRTPKIKYSDLKEYYYDAGDGAVAHLHITYGFPQLPTTSLFTGTVAIKPHVYREVIQTWQEMSKIVIARDDMKKSDQEVLSAAVWHLRLTHAYGKKKWKRKEYRNRWCMQYAGGHKAKMKRDYRRLYGNR